PIKSYRQHWLKPISRTSMKREVKYLEHFQKNGTYAPESYKSK
ncbi:MAG: RIO-like serine/threonine protein kinase, partial [Oleispira sp.]